MRVVSFERIVAVLAVCGISLTSASAQPLPAASPSGAEVYRAACTTCHGRDGRGAPRASVAFANRLPDFSDCRFAQREADADWVAIIHNGGPARAFAQMMPAYGSTLSLAEIQAALDHIRTFCVDQAWPRGDLNLPRPLATEKAFPEDEVVITTSGTRGTNASVTTKTIYERRFGSRTQMELIAPVSSHRTADSTWRTGVGDIAAALKRVLMHDVRRGHIVSAAFEVAMPTGSTAKGFGGGTTVLEPSILYGQLLPRDAFVQAQAGIAVPWDRPAAREAFWRTGIGQSFKQGQFGRTWSPIVELLGAREMVRGEPALWDIVPQMQITLSTRQHVRVSGGLRVPINERTNRSTQVVTYLLWDWYDGPLFAGW